MEPNDIVIGDKVVLVDNTNLDTGLQAGTEGFVNSVMTAEDAKYIMFHPKGMLEFFWMAAWRFQKIED